MNVMQEILKIDELPRRIRDDVREVLETEETATRYDILHVWLQYNGIIGFTSDIAAIINQPADK